MGLRFDFFDYDAIGDWWWLSLPFLTTMPPQATSLKPTSATTPFLILRKYRIVYLPKASFYTCSRSTLISKSLLLSQDERRSAHGLLWPRESTLSLGF